MKNYSALRPPARRLKSRATESEARLRGLDPAIPDYLLKLHQRLIVAIDRSTESQRQRIQRAQGWPSRWEAMPHPPARTRSSSG